MTRSRIIVIGLILLGVLAGHLALNAAGSGKAVLEKTAKVFTAGTSTSVQAQIAAEAAAKLAAEKPDMGVQRKAKQAAAIAAGHDATIVCNLSDRDLDKLVAGLPVASNADLRAYAEKKAAEPTVSASTVEESTTPAEVEEARAVDAAHEAVARMQNGDNLSAAEKDLAMAYLAQHPEEDVGRGGNGSLDNIGGPDTGNYFFVDNMGSDTATYNWIELRGDAGVTWINAWGTHDDSYSTSRHPIGFPFTFYGVAQDSFRVGTNGYLQFSTTSSSRFNACLPSTEVAGPAIFPFWDDLHLDYGGISTGTDVVGYKNFGSYTVIEFDSIGHCCAATNGSFKFEVILFNDGKIKMQYNNMVLVDAQDSTATIGIQSNGAAGSSGLTYVCNLTGIQPASGRAIWFYQYFYPNDFATVSLLSPTGVYAPNSVVSVSARFKNAGTVAQSAPVKYSFNGGPVQTEATGVLAAGQTEDHTFATQITLPGTTGSYPLTVWSDLATEQARGNDTMRVNVQVFAGGDCNSAITLNGFGPDSALYNNCGAGDNSPGQPCGASGQDMVFKIDVPNGYQAVLWQTSNAIDSRHSLRWGGACPGSNFVDCQDSPDEKMMRFVNQTGTTQTAYLVVGGWSTSTACGNFKVAWQLTTCGAAAAPLVEGFEGPATPLLPDCWSTVQTPPATLTTSPLWENYSTSPRTGTRVASVAGAATGNDDWLFSRGVNLTGGVGYVVEFYWRGASATVPESLEVKAGTSNTVSGMTLTVMPMDTIKRTVYAQRVGNFTPSTTGTYYFGWHSTTMRSAGRTYIDDAQIYPSGACSAPLVTVNSITGQDSVVMLATASGGSGGPAEYQWFTGTGCQEANRIAGARSASYVTHASGTFSCRAWIIDSVNCASCDSGYATVVDCSLPATLPVFEGFESTTGTALPTCWAVQNYDGDARNWEGYSTNPRTGTRNAHCQYSVAGTIPNDWLYTRPMALTAGTNYILDFWWRQQLASTSWNDSLQVVLTTAPNNASTVSTLVPEFYINNVGTYQNSVTVFTVPSTGTYYVAFLYRCGDDEGGVLIDDISIYQQGFCVAPDSVRVPAASAIGAVMLTATVYGGFGGPAEYQWYQGTDCATGTLIPGANSATYTTTVAGSYACKAWRANAATCSACDSAYAAVLPDPCTPLTIPMFENFNGVTAPALPNCWRIYDGDAASPVWVTSTNNAYSSPNSVFIGWRSPTVNDWLISPPLALTGGQNYMLDYAYRAASTSYREELEVKMGSLPSAGALVTTIVPLDTFRFTTYAQKSVMFTPPTTGNYYLGWHATTPNGLGIYMDDIRVYPRGGCGAPDSVIVPAAIGVGSVTLSATVYGGFGGAAQYQWFRGPDCLFANRIEGAHGATFSTDTSGVFSCRAWRADSLTCAACDSALATITPPPPGETCGTAIALTVPVPGTPTVVSDATTAFYANCTDVCGSSTSSGPDVFYSLTLTSCRRIAMKLTGGDTHLSIYEGVGNCCANPALCNEDDALFAPLPPWDVAEQHPGGTNAYIAADMNPGTYVIRVGFAGTLSGTYALTLYDNGSCIASCDSASQLTVYVSPSNPNQVWLNFHAPDSGSYVVYSSTNRNNDGDPRGGDPMWVTETTLHAAAAGLMSWTDPVAVIGYKNYSVVRDCGSPQGRCCYGDPGNPTCANNSQAQCEALAGSWNQYRNCLAHPCPVVQPAGTDSCNGVGELRGALPISVDGSTLGMTDNFSVRDVATVPTCWSGTYYSATATAAGPDVCFGWTVPATGTYTISTCGANTTYDTSLLLYTFTCPTPPVNATDLICGADDVCTSYRAEIQSVALTAGQHVLIVVDTYSSSGGGTGGAFNLTITTP
jgi:hypothetical protein